MLPNMLENGSVAATHTDTRLPSRNGPEAATQADADLTIQNGLEAAMHLAWLHTISIAFVLMTCHGLLQPCMHSYTLDNVVRRD